MSNRIMKLNLLKLLGLALSVPQATSASLNLPPAICVPVAFSVSATTQNAVFLSPPNPNNQTAIIEFFVVGLANERHWPRYHWNFPSGRNLRRWWKLLLSGDWLSQGPRDSRPWYHVQQIHLVRFGNQRCL